MLILTGATLARADNTACTGAILLVPDGSPQTGTITAGLQERWFKFVAKPNQSYTVVVENLSPAEFQFAITVLTSCGGPALVALGRDEVEPATFGGSSGGGQISFFSPGNTILFPSIQGDSAASGAGFRVRVEETTLYSPAWTTNSTFDTYWTFQNTTNATILGKLVLLATDGTVMQTFNTPLIAPGGIFGTNTASLGVTRNRVGNAVFIHDGPPGAIQIKANQANFAVSPPFIELVPFQTKRQFR